MNGPTQWAHVILLSLLAGAACSASEELPKESVMQEEVRLRSLHAGIELASADSMTAGDSQPLVVFHVSNRRDQAVKILKWNTPLETELSADVFEVFRNGKPVEYQGRVVKRGTPQQHDYVVVPAGGRVDASVDIGRYYDINEPGEYTLSYKPYLADGVMQLNQETVVVMDAATLTFTVN